MTRLGAKQLKFMSGLSGGKSAIIVGNSDIRRLAARGLLRPLGENGDSFYVITSALLRAVADAMDNGALPPLTMADFRKPRAER